MEMMTENFCDECGDTVHAIFDQDEFYSFKVGRIRCDCGEIVLPCNECFDENGNHYDCVNCPWKDSEVKKEMSDFEYVKWKKDNEPNVFQLELKGEFGDYYKELAEKVLASENQK